MASKTPPKPKAAPKAATKKSTVMPLNRSVNFKSPMVLAVIGLFVALGLFFILKTFASQSASPYPCPSPQPTIKQGSTGNCVKYLQWSFNTYFHTSLAVDGQFGAATASTVKYFQALGGLTADGIVGPQTWAKVNALGGGGGFDPASQQYTYLTTGIGWHDGFGSTRKVRVNPTTVKDLPVLITHVDGFDYNIMKWWGPYRNMKVPAGAHGVQACYRVSVQSDEEDWAGNVDIFLDYKLFSNGTTLKSTRGVYTPTTQDHDSAFNLTYHITCLQYPASPGTTLTGLSTQIVSDFADHGAIPHYTLGIVGTELSYY